MRVELHFMAFQSQFKGSFVCQSVILHASWLCPQNHNKTTVVIVKRLHTF